MIERQSGKVRFVCDGCGDILDTDHKHLDKARKQAVRIGWTTSFLAPSREWHSWCRFCDPWADFYNLPSVQINASIYPKFRGALYPPAPQEKKVKTE